MIDDGTFSIGLGFRAAATVVGPAKGAVKICDLSGAVVGIVVAVGFALSGDRGGDVDDCPADELPSFAQDRDRLRAVDNIGLVEKVFVPLTSVTLVRATVLSAKRLAATAELPLSATVTFVANPHVVPATV